MIKEITKEEAELLPIYKGNKVVNAKPGRIVCYAPLAGPIPKEGVKSNIFSTGDILYVLGREGSVEEILKDGSKVKLTLDNYDRWLDEGDVPGPGYIPEIPEQKEEETEEPGEGDNKDPEPEVPVTPPEEKEDEEEVAPDTQDDALDNIPEGLTKEEEDEWLDKQLND